MAGYLCNSQMVHNNSESRSSRKRSRFKLEYAKNITDRINGHQNLNKPS